MKWTKASCMLSLALATLVLALSSAAENPATLKAEASAAFDKGDFYRAYGLYEEALVEDLANDNKLGVAQGLTDLGRALAAERSHEKALSHFRSALLKWIQLDHAPGTARTLHAMAGVYRELGDESRVERLTQQALLVIDGNVRPDLVISVALPMACGDDNSFAPDKSKIPGGTWTAWGIGTSEATALQNALQQAFTGMGYLPTCKDKCPDGSAPAAGECVADVNSSLPTSTTPADYGSPQWTVSNKQNGQVVIGPVAITQFPAGLNVEQSCSACC